MTVIRDNKWFLSIMACLILIIGAVFFTEEMVVDAATRSTAAERYQTAVFEEDEYPSSMFGTMSRAGADYLNNLKSGVLKDEWFKDGKIIEPEDVGSAAGLLGYTDSFVEPINNVMLSWYSSDSVGTGTYNVDGFDDDIYKNYAKTGIILEELGIDQTYANSVNGGIRQVIGLVILAMYVLAGFTGRFWEYVLNFLSILNPFILFRSDGREGAMLDALHNGVTGEQTSNLQAGVDGILAAINGFYTQVKELGATLFIPALFVVAMFVWLVIKKGSEGGKTFKNVVIRCLFVAIGVPLMLSVYSTALDLVKDMTVSSSKVSDSIILSSFVDFESYAKNTWLKQDDKIFSYDDYDLDKKALKDEKAGDDVRIKCAYINTECLGSDKNMKLDASIPIFGIVRNGDDELGLSKYDLTIIKNTFGKYTSTGAGANPMDESAADNADQIIDMLKRYASGDRYTAGLFETQYKSALMSCASSGFWSDNEDVDYTLGNLYRAYAVSDQWQDFLTNDFSDVYCRVSDFGTHMTFGLNVGDPNAGKQQVMGMWTMNQLGRGASNSDKGEGPLMVDTLPKRFDSFTFSFENPGSVDVPELGKLNTYWGSVSGGLSAIGMYNYLSSAFTKDSITVHSSKNIDAEIQKFDHMSVNVVGNKYMSIIYLFDVFVLMAAMCVICYGYGFGLILSNVKTMVKLIPSVFTGSLGYMRGIATSFILTGAVVGEILVTCVLYNSMIAIVPSFYQLLEVPMSIILQPLCDSVWGGLYPIVSGIVSIVIVATAIGKMLQYRKALCTAVAEMVTSVVNKFMGFSVGAPKIT